MYQVLSLFKSFLFWGSRILENKLWFTTCISPLNLRVSCPVCTFISALFMLSGPNTVDCLNKFQLKVHFILIICIYSQFFMLWLPQGLANDKDCCHNLLNSFSMKFFPTWIKILQFFKIYIFRSESYRTSGDLILIGLESRLWISVVLLAHLKFKCI